MFTEEGGWPYGEVRDTDAILDKEREIGLENPVRKVRQDSYHSIDRFANKIADKYLPCRRSQSPGCRDL